MKLTKEQYEQLNLEELERCKRSPAYFYNKYIRINGQKPTPITDKDIEESELARASYILKGRRGNLLGMFPAYMLKARGNMGQTVAAEYVRRTIFNQKDESKKSKEE
jgi:hypothetical protein